MGLLERFRQWRRKRQREEALAPVKQDLYDLAHEYETFPKMISLKKGDGWILTAPRYRMVIASTPAEAIRKFRQRNPRKRRS